MALPLLSQQCLHAKTHADFQCPPTPPLPFSLPIIFFKGGKRSLVLPPLSPLRRLQHFLEGMLQFLSRLEVLSPSPVRALGAAAAPALISGGQRSHKRVPGAGEMRQVAGRDHAGEGPASGSRQAPPHSHPSLSHSNSPTGRLRWLPAGTAAQHAQCFCFFTLPRSKVPEPLHRRSGLEQRAQSRPGSRTALPAHPTCPKTSPGVTAGDSWELPRVSLAWAQLVPPITCELYGGAEGGRFQS